MAAPRKLALLAGCNYEGNRGIDPLPGCIYDVTSFKQVLKDRFDFDEADITLFKDSDGTPAELQPTGANIKSKLRELIAEANENDLIVFYFSGHGAQFLDDTGDLDEAITPTDLNLITDIDFADILSNLKDNTSFVFFSDSCHSGGLLDKARRPLEFSNAFVNAPAAGYSKLIPYPALKRILNARTRGGDNQSVSQQMKELFGDKASLKFTANKEKLTTIKDSFRASPASKILFSACQANEYAGGGKAIDGNSCGAFTGTLEYFLRDNPERLTNGEVIDKVKKWIPVLYPYLGLSQHPQLYCDQEDREKIFLFQEHDGPPAPEASGLPNRSGAVAVSGDGSKALDDDNKTYALEKIKDVLEAYYLVSSKTFKHNFEDLYEKVATTKGSKGAVSTKDWVEIVLSCGNTVLNHLFFTCLPCFKVHEDTYDTCLTEKTKSSNGHQNHTDTHYLLEDQRRKEKSPAEKLRMQKT